jgi:VanZ family protein
VRHARIAAALWGGFLFFLTSWPNPPQVRAGGFPLDKLTHFFLYAVEAFLRYRAIGWKGRPGFAFCRLVAVTGTMALWGMLDEAHQEWIPGRTMDSADLAADIIGAAVGTSIAGARTGSKSRRRRSERDHRGGEAAIS